MKGLFAGAIVILSMVLLLAVGSADGQDKPKHSIKEVMIKAMKTGLLKKVGEGKATAEEKDLLIELFEALHDNAPPKGPEEGWKTRTKALLDAAKTAKNDDTQARALQKLANCASCHKEHRGK